VLRSDERKRYDERMVFLRRPLETSAALPPKEILPIVSIRRVVDSSVAKGGCLELIE
jgi:hypothetical protein